MVDGHVAKGVAIGIHVQLTQAEDFAVDRIYPHQVVPSLIIRLHHLHAIEEAIVIVHGHGYQSGTGVADLAALEGIGIQTIESAAVVTSIDPTVVVGSRSETL